MGIEQKDNIDEIKLKDLGEILKKRIKYIFFFILLVVVMTTIIAVSLPKIYRGDAVYKIPQFEIVSSNITAKELIDLIGRIDGDKKQKLLPKTYNHIVNIKFRALNDLKDKVEIIFESDDIAVIPLSLVEITQYMNEIELIKVSVKEEKEKLLVRSGELSNFINESTSLLTEYSRILKSGRLVAVGFNPLDLNKKITDARLEKLVIDQAHQRIDGGITIARQLDIKSKHVKPKVFVSVIISAIASIFIGLLWVLSEAYWVTMRKQKSV
jgi:capsular polysaccharide biosynthesis protein